MLEDNKILNLLANDKIFYLMYPGGAGGEFLSTLLSVHSTTFRPIPASSIDHGSNRTIVILPIFYQCVAEMTPDNYDSSILIDNIKKWHFSNNIDLIESINEAYNFLSLSSKPALIRTHIINSEIFTSTNTVKIQVSTPSEKQYSKICLYIKTGTNELTNESLNTWAKYAAARSPKAQPIVATVKYYVSNAMHAGRICSLNHCYALFDVLSNNTPNHALAKTLSESTPAEIISYISSNREQSSYVRNERDTSIHIPFFDLFKYGVISSVFELPTDSVRQQFIEWHHNNVSLFQKFKINYQEFVPTIST